MNEKINLALREKRGLVLRKFGSGICSEILHQAFERI